MYKADELNQVPLQRAYNDYLQFLGGLLDKSNPPTLDEFIKFSNENDWNYYEDGEFY
ncbi:hypothetical protein [Oceanobacillus profundus]|uniref:hypothetical protein n=1 Tax=Oceanobacillus profundus TaxID=372463 RepID=UPI0026E41130|nr:hypothetical protein [Oceanobacillus profundus]MDO6451703.1 hypothetical protein [Oceanobacillus profundus]